MNPELVIAAYLDLAELAESGEASFFEEFLLAACAELGAQVVRPDAPLYLTPDQTRRLMRRMGYPAEQIEVFLNQQAFVQGVERINAHGGVA